MSVQAGIWNFDGRPVDQKLLTDLSESLEHQGPDDESFHVDGSIALLYRPFHTTAESRREKQPYISRRGFVLIWDGRLDNRDDLIRELRSELEANPTDVAIIAAAFDRWKTDCFRRIVGDWAVSVWKPEQRELIFAVDYMAVRHIFYYLKADRISWSTDLGPLVLLSDDKFHVDDDYVAGYFANDPDAYLTPYCEIREAPPGQFVRICEGRAIVERYWRVGPELRIRYKTDSEYEEHFRHVFRQSVRRRLRTDTPILAELSGGLDSSSIVCMADDIIAKGEAPTRRLDTLSYYDNTEVSGDDWIHFQKIEAKRRQIGAHIDASKVGSAPGPLEYPAFFALPGYFGIGRELEAERGDVVRQGRYRVVLSGIGGDEFMGGNPDPRAQIADLIVQFRPFTLVRQLIAWSLAKRRPLTRLLWESALELVPAFLARYAVQEARVEPWIQKEFAQRTNLARRRLGTNEHFGRRLPTRRSTISTVLATANKLSKCKSPAYALEEVRYPYLDWDLIAFVLSIPADQLLRPGERRSLMRRSLVGIVPLEILSRRTKQFGVRTHVLALEKRMDELLMAFESSLASQVGYLNQDCFLHVISAARNGKIALTPSVLQCISFEFWLRSLVAVGRVHGATMSAPTFGGTDKLDRRQHGFSITLASSLTETF
jgi:asparagine synthase (glutamine-hydrolysing)